MEFYARCCGSLQMDYARRTSHHRDFAGQSSIEGQVNGLARTAITVSCLVIFHRPDGKEIRIDTAHISAVQSAEGFGEHVASGVKTILYTPGKNFGIIETPAEAGRLIRNCVEEED
jgi:hypothetical protein